MKNIMVIMAIYGVSGFSFASEITVENCLIAISENDFEKRDDGSYYEKVDYAKFEYPKKEIDKIDIEKDSSFLLSKDVDVFKSGNLYMFSYVLSSHEVDIKLNTVVTIDHNQAFAFFGFTIEDFKNLSKNCDFVFSESSIMEYQKWEKAQQKLQ